MVPVLFMQVGSELTMAVASAGGEGIADIVTSPEITEVQPSELVTVNWYVVAAERFVTCMLVPDPDC